MLRCWLPRLAGGKIDRSELAGVREERFGQPAVRRDHCEIRAMLKVSWVHRILRIKPGRVPKWVCSPSSCAGLDLLSVVGSAVLLFALLLSRTSVVPAVALAVLLVWYVIFVMIPFESCERSARARRRRNECVYCGRSLGKPTPESSLICGCSPHAVNPSAGSTSGPPVE